MPGVEIRIADNGEVLFRSPGVFKEYYKNPEADGASQDADGWVNTGDAGLLRRRGHLKIIDRAKDVGRLNDGTLFAPKYIENKLKFFPDIKEAVAYGHGRDFVRAFINIDLTAVGSWAERNNVAYGSYQELAANPRVWDDQGARRKREPRSSPRTRSSRARRSTASWCCTRNSTPTTAS
jgi:long-chain acyl-CoA synthetase